MIAQTKFRSVIFPDNTIMQNALIVILSSVFLGVISQVAIHLWWPVPITLQSAAVVWLGLTLGSWRALSAVMLYLLEGAVGLPVFAGGLSGLICFAGPSGGYLCGFLPAAFVAGFFMEKGLARNFITTFIAAILSSSIIFLLGVLHLQGLVGWQKAWAIGVTPFLFIEPIKLLVASIMAAFCWKQSA